MKTPLNTPKPLPAVATPTDDTPPVAETSVEAPFTAQQRVSSYWNIQSGIEDGTIVATHTDGRTYSGSIAAFNKLLRGE